MTKEMLVFDQCFMLCTAECVGGQKTLHFVAMNKKTKGAVRKHTSREILNMPINSVPA